MFTKTLLSDTFRAIQLVSHFPSIKNAYLAGGTSLALQLGHRISVDLDFFTSQDFEEIILSQELSKFPEFVEDGKSWKTIWGKINQTKFSYFYYKYPLIDNLIDFEGIKLAGLKDISAMKIHTLEERGTKRDFIDVYFLTKEYSLEQMFDFYDQKYGCLKDHLYSILRSLDYFADADQDADPQMIAQMSWQKIKEYFKREAVQLARKSLTP